MNDFLKNQLQRKVDKFFEGKSDLFVVRAQSWLSYGGMLNGKPVDISDSDFDALKSLVGEKVLESLLSDMVEKPKFFSKLQPTEKDYLQNLSMMFHDECYQRLRKKCLDEKIKENDRIIANGKRRMAKLAKQIADLETKTGK